MKLPSAKSFGTQIGLCALRRLRAVLFVYIAMASARFADSYSDAIFHVPSSWQRVKQVVSSAVQTKPIQLSAAAVQTTEHVTMAVQTEPEPVRAAMFAPDSSAALVTFVERAACLVCPQLVQNLTSLAFDGYNVRWEEDESKDGVHILHTVRHMPAAQSLQCTAVAWNVAGSVVAAAYGRLDHQHWCTHKSFICTVGYGSVARPAL